MSKARGKKKHEPRSYPLSSAGTLLPVWLYLGIVAVASLLPPDSMRLWGLNIGAWLPPQLWLAVLALPALLLLLPPVRLYFENLELVTILESHGRRKRSWLVPGVVAMLLLLAIVLFQTEYPFLGDGVVYRSEVFRLLHDPTRISALVKPTSVLTGVLIEAVAQVLRPEHTDTPYFVVCLLAFLSFVFIAIRLLRGTTPMYRLLLVSPVMLGSAVLLYFTYVELYVMQYTFAALYCISIFSWRQGNHGVLFPAVLILISLGFGISSAIFIPSLIVTLLLVKRPALLAVVSRRSATLIAFLVAGVAAVLLVEAATDMAWYGQFFMPFHESGTDPLFDPLSFRYTVFSSVHLLDIPNILFLHLGPLLLVLIVLLSRIRWRTLLEDDIAFILLCAAAGGSLQLFLGASLFALARDWDLMLLPTLPWAFLAIRLILLVPEPAKRRIIAAGSMLTISATTVLWLAVNLSPASADRFEHILDADREWLGAQWLHDGYRALEQYHGIEGNTADADRIIVKMLELGYDKLDTYERYFLHVLSMKDPTRQMRAAIWLMDRMARDTVVTLPRASWRHIDAATLRSKLASVIIETATTTGYEGFVSSALQRYEPLLPAWREAGLLRALTSTSLPPADRYAMVKNIGFTESTDPLLYPYRANLAQLAGMCDTAAYYFEAMIARDSHEYPRAYLGLALVHLTCTKDTSKAIGALRDMQENCKLAREELAYAAKLLAQLPSSL